jgi:hypothetical protein
MMPLPLRLLVTQPSVVPLQRQRPHRTVLLTLSITVQQRRWSRHRSRCGRARIDLIEDVHQRKLELQQGHDQ